MANTVCVGAQWGDEGKGKIVDVLTESADMVVRTQGGNNAGHTVISGRGKFVLHLIPSGILHKGKTCVIGNGVVMDPVDLVGEIEGLRAQGVTVSPRRLLISESAHLVLPSHRAFDQCRELARGRSRIGTTGRGIGPAYGDKIERTGLRAGEMRDGEAFARAVRRRLTEANRRLRDLGARPLPVARTVDDCLAAAETLRPFLTNTVLAVHRALDENKEILFEGAQGTYLDIDFGTYPYVTSSNTTAGGACTGSGVPPTRVDRVLGVVKAYTTRVGEGPFPTEDAAFSRRMHGMGREFGATTGRARRCGWFDAVMTRYAALINGMDAIAVTNLDGLDGVDTIRICTGYRLGRRRLDHPPADIRELHACQPVYVEMPGWSEPTAGVTTFHDLPARARDYLARIAGLTGTRLRIVSVGPNRRETIMV